MTLPAKRVRIKDRTPRTPVISQPKQPLLFPGIINEKTVLCLKTRAESAAEEYYNDRVQPLSCAHEDNFPEFREGIRLFRRLLYKMNSKLKPLDPILPDINGPDVTSQKDIRIYLPIEACDLRAVEDDWGYVKLKIKKASAENETDMERTDYFRSDLTTDGQFVNCHLVCQKLLRGFQLALAKKKLRRRRRKKRKGSGRLSGIVEDAIDVVAMETLAENTEKTEITKTSTNALINGILGTGVSLKKQETLTVENQTDSTSNEQTSSMDTTDHSSDNNIASVSPKSEQVSTESNNNQNPESHTNGQNNTDESSKTIQPSEQINDDENLHINLNDDDSSKKSRPDTTESDGDFSSEYGSTILATELLDNEDLDGPDDFSDLVQLTLTPQDPTGYPIVHYHDYRYHIIPAIKLRRADCDMFIAAAYCNDHQRESPVIWRKTYFNKERFIFRSMQAADGGNRLKIFQMLKNLVQVDKALAILNDDVIMAAMLHDFDHRVDETPRWQRNNLEASFVGVLETLNDLLGVNNGVPHFFMKRVNLLENVPLLQIARLRGRIRCLVSNPSVLERAFKLQPAISESFDF